MPDNTNRPPEWPNGEVNVPFMPASGRAPAPQPAIILAQQIADALFVNGSLERGQRLAIIRDVVVAGRSIPRDLGGWSEAAAVRQIERVLKATSPAEPEPEQGWPPLKELVAMWRAKAALNTRFESQPNVATDLKAMAFCWGEARRECARELESALPAPPSSLPSAPQEPQV